MLKLTFVTALAALTTTAGAYAHGATTAPTPSPTKGVVLVETNLAYENAQAAGTGIVLTSNGEVVTNNHVIRGATTINVVVPSTHKTYTASVVGYDIGDDVALLKLNNASKLATATIGNSAKVAYGQFARAVGNAHGGGKLVITTGKITGVGKSITVQNDDGTTAQLTGLVQTSAKLVPGDSGGPLLNAKGQVIAIDAAGSPNYQFEASDGYAIPINKAIALTKQMQAGKASALVHIGKTAFLGVSVAQNQAGQLAIASLVPGGAAEAAGLEQGDVITAVDGAAIATLVDLRNALFAHHPGDTITVGYVDGFGNQAQATITLADGPPQ
ncbi:MAG: trypsin-like peptidase domain-containing protein [Actinomycetota bacterium]